MKSLMTLQNRISAPVLLLGTLISATSALAALDSISGCAPAPSGLVGWWAGEGNANDSAGTNNGTLQGGATFAAGKVGQAFDVSPGETVVVSDSPSLRLTNELTLEAWVNARSFDSGVGCAVINKLSINSGNNGYQLVLLGNTIQGLLNSPGTSWPSQRIISPPILSTGVWYHIAFTYDQSAMKLYCNGQPVATNVIGAHAIATSPSELRISGADDHGYFDGLIDEASVYNRALTATEIAAIYNAGSAGKCPPAPPVNCAPPPAGLVGWWAGQGNANDSAGTNNGTLQGGVTFAAGEVGQAFDVSPGDTVVVTDSPSLRLTSELTLEAWVNARSFDSGVGCAVINKLSINSGLNGYQLILVGNTIQGLLNSPGTTWPSQRIISPPILSTGVWYHIAFTYDQSAMKLYCNGQPVATNIIGAHAIATSPSELRISGADDHGYFDGLIDEASVYNRALTATEIAAIYNAGSAGKCPVAPPVNCTPPSSGLVSWWAGEGNTLDSVGTNNGSLQGGASYAVGEVGQAFKFDGTSGYVKIAKSPSLDVGHYVTVEFWMKPDPDNLMNTCCQGLVTSDFYHIELSNGTGSTVGASFCISTDGGATWYQTAIAANGGGAAVTPGVWHHVAGTYDGTKIQLYIDGQPWGVPVAASGTISPMGPTSFVCIGSEEGRNVCTSCTRNRFFKGEIDEASIYNRALSAAEIAAIYNAGSAGKCPVAPPSNCTPPPAGLVSWWAAEGNALDSADSNNGTLQGGATFAAGKVGQAFSFDPASGGTVVVPDSPNLRLTSQLTIEAWINTRSTNADRGIVSKVGIATGDNGYQLGLSGNNLLGQFNSPGVGWPGYQIMCPLPITLGVWHHVAWSYDQSAMKLYFDGEPVATNVIGAHPLATTSTPLRISGADDHAYFDGMIDEPAVYNRALSVAEIAAIYNASSAGKCALPPSIVVQPQGQIATAGSSPTLNVVAAGTPPLSYQWKRNTALIEGATAGSLTLTNVQFSQAGTYSVLVSNGAGSTNSSDAVLTVIPQVCAPPPAGMVGWWPGEGNALDSAAGNNGIVQGATTFTPGMVGQAFDFNPASGTVVVPDSASLRLTSQLTIEAWINPRTLNVSPGHAIVSKLGIASGDNGYQFILVGNTIQGLFNSPGSSWPSQRITSGPIISTGVWYHVAWTYDQSAMKLYCNGQPVATNVIGAHAIATSVSDLRISGADTQAYFDGLIDEPSVYSRALSSAEIAAIYNAGSLGKCGMPPSIVVPLQSQTVYAGSAVTFMAVAGGTPALAYQWQFGNAPVAGATGSSLTLPGVQLNQAGSYHVVVTNLFGSATSSDAVLAVQTPPPCAGNFPSLVSWWPGEGNANDALLRNNGTLQGAVSFAPGVVGQAFNFNPASGTVIVPDSPSLRLTNQLTIEAWINTRSINSSDASAIVSKVGGSGGLYGYQFLLNGRSLQGIFNGPGQSWPSQSITSAAIISAGAWYHVAWTYDQSVMKLYCNGQPVATNVIGAHPIAASSSALHISGVDSTHVFFDGLIDEPAVYNRALSAEEITAIYTAGSSGKCELAPAVQTPPQDRIAECTSDVTFSVTATGMSPLGYQWYFGSDPTHGATTSSLTLSNVSLAQAGSYSVLISNAYGTAMGGPATLTLVDTTPPNLSCPTNKVLEFQDETGIAATYTVEAADPCSAVTVLATPPSGSLFPIGMTPVLVQASDSSSNSAQCSFTVTVLGAQGVKSNVLAELTALRAGASPGKLDDAIQHLASSLNPAYWVDQTHLMPKLGNTAMNEEKLAAGALEDLLGAKGSSIDPAVLQGLILRIVKCDRILAVICIQEAAQGGLNPKKVAEDLAMVAKGDAEADKGHYAVAIEDYRNAWRHALQLHTQLSVGPDGATRLEFVGNSSKSYQIEMSTDLVNWVTLGTCAADDQGNVQFDDPGPANQPARFYRAVEQ